VLLEYLKYHAHPKQTHATRPAPYPIRAQRKPRIEQHTRHILDRIDKNHSIDSIVMWIQEQQQDLTFLSGIGARLARDRRLVEAEWLLPGPVSIALTKERAIEAALKMFVFDTAESCTQYLESCEFRAKHSVKHPTIVCYSAPAGSRHVHVEVFPFLCGARPMFSSTMLAAWIDEVHEAARGEEGSTPPGGERAARVRREIIGSLPVHERSQTNLREVLEGLLPPSFLESRGLISTSKEDILSQLKQLSESTVGLLDGTFQAPHAGKRRRGA
jgi:hypothetical protein